MFLKSAHTSLLSPDVVALVAAAMGSQNLIVHPPGLVWSSVFPKSAHTSLLSPDVVALIVACSCEDDIYVLLAAQHRSPACKLHALFRYRFPI